MRIYFFVFFVFFVFSLCGLDVSVECSRAIVMNADNGAVLFEKNAHEKASPASITKLASALYALESGDVDFEKMVRCLPKCLVTMPKPVKESRGYEDPPYYLEPDGSDFGLVKGEVLSLHALLHGMMLASGNDAANVVAHYVGGSIDAFMQGMNNFLKTIGCHHTHFSNPHGLYHPNHFTTAYDVALIARFALRNEKLCEIVKKASYERPETNKSEGYEVKQTNRLLREGEYFYPRAIGLKTGYIEDAGYCLAAVAEENGRQLIAVLLGGEKPSHRYHDAIALFDAAFAQEQVSRTLFRADEARFAKGPVDGKLTEDCVITYYPSEKIDVSPEIEWHSLKPPIKKGAVIGTLLVADKKMDIVATKRIAAPFSFWYVVLGIALGIVLMRALRALR